MPERAFIRTEGQHSTIMPQVRFLRRPQPYRTGRSIMKVKLPVVTKNEIKDGKHVFETGER